MASLMLLNFCMDFRWIKKGGECPPFLIVKINNYYAVLMISIRFRGALRPDSMDTAEIFIFPFIVLCLFVFILFEYNILCYRLIAFCIAEYKVLSID